MDTNHFSDANLLFGYLKSLCDLQERCKTLEKKLELVEVQTSFPLLENKQSIPLVNKVKLSEDEWNNFKLRMYFHKKEMLYSLKQDACFLIFEKAKVLVEEKQIFISAYLQDLHIYLSATPGFRVPALKLVKDKEFDDFKIL